MGESTTPSRLKRLSLVPGKPATARKGGDSIDSTSSAGTSASTSSSTSTSASANPESGNTTISISTGSTSTSTTPTPSALLSSSPLSPLATRPTRSTRHPTRSSISYAPATPSGSTLLPTSTGTTTDAPSSNSTTPNALSPTMSRSNSRSPIPTDQGLTLAERHADLLRMIAMRERRVNELKQATQEAALSKLRDRWTSIARSDHTLPTSAPPAPPANLARTTSPAPVPAAVPEESVSDELSLNTLWTAITHDADETIQEGKRFWGQFVKTVSAAAGGTVPEDKGKKPLTGGLGLGGVTLGSLGASLNLSGGGSGSGKRRGSSGSGRSTSTSTSPTPGVSPNLRPSLSPGQTESSSSSGKGEVKKNEGEGEPLPSPLSPPPTVVLENVGW